MNTEIKTPKHPIKTIVKILLFVLCAIVFLIGSLITLLFIYENDIKNVIVNELNKNLNAEVKINPENINITIIKTFPDCSIQFNDVLILEALPVKKRDTLLFAAQLSLLFNAKDIWNKKYEIEKIKLEDAYANLLVLKNGKNNYTFWKNADNKQGNDSVKFKLNMFTIENCLLKYKNKQQNFKTQFQIKSLSFKGNFDDKKYDLESKGRLVINNITHHKINYLQDKTLNFNLDVTVNGPKFSINTAALKLNQLAIDLKGDFIYKDSLQKIDLEFNAPDLDINSTLSLLPEKYKYRINDYSSGGNFYANGKIRYESGTNYFLSSSFGIKNGEITYKPKNTKANDINILGSVEMSSKRTVLNLNSFYLKLNNDEMSGNLILNDFSNPNIHGNAKAHFNLKNLQNFWPIDTVTFMEGTLNLSVEAEGLISDFQKQIFSDRVHLNFNAAIDTFQLQFKNDEKLYSIENASVSVRDKDVEVHDLRLKRGQSDLKINGKMPGLIAALTNSANPLIIEGNLLSNQIVLEDFLPKSTGTTSSNNNPLISDNIEFKLNAAILKFNFGKFEAKNITGNIECKNQKVFANDIKLQTSNGEVELNAFANNSKNILEVAIQSTFKNININSLFTQFNNFGQSSLVDNNIKGIASATVDFSATWNNKLEVNDKSIITTCNLNINLGELIDFKPLMSLSDYVDVKELKRIKFSTLQSKINIKDRVITIPKTSIKNSALDIEFWGSQTFDYNIDYHIQLLISDYLSKKRKKNEDEFGPIENDPTNRRSAFILMTGNIDNPIIKYDRKGLKQKVKEDIKAEKQNLKQLFKEEFSIFKRDTAKIQKQKKSEQFFELEKPEKKKPEKAKENDDEDF